jgi:acetyl esterase
VLRQAPAFAKPASAGEERQHEGLTLSPSKGEAVARHYRVHDTMAAKGDFRMALNPQCAAVIEAAARGGQSVFDARDPVEARERYGASTAVFAPATPALESVDDRTVPGPDGPVPVRVYRPEGVAAALPVLAFFHGGGWVFGDLDSHDHVCRALCAEAGCLVVAVDYRLAPEHKFPAGLEDSYAVTAWLAEHADELGGDGARLAVGGDSAGGNLAAAVCLAARQRGGPALAFQLLIYPATDHTADTVSLARNGDGYLLTRGAIEWCKGCYLRDDADARNPLASPLLADDLGSLPPAFVQTAEFDPLLDEGRAYAERLAAAGVPAEHVSYPGMVHGFVRMGALIDDAHTAIADAAARLRASLAA